MSLTWQWRRIPPAIWPFRLFGHLASGWISLFIKTRRATKCDQLRNWWFVTTIKITWVTWRPARVPDRKFVKNETFFRRSLDFQSFWYLSLGMPIFVINRDQDAFVIASGNFYRLNSHKAPVLASWQCRSPSQLKQLSRSWQACRTCPVAPVC